MRAGDPDGWRVLVCGAPAMIPCIEITLGEYCWLERRRAGQTAEWWALHHAMSVEEVRRREHDEQAVRLTAQQVANSTNLTVSAGEYSALARRRAGDRMAAVAARYGVSRMTVWKAEHSRTASSLPLACWWHRRGVALPRLGAETVRLMLAAGINA